jgi:hypothetical protein
MTPGTREADVETLAALQAIRETLAGLATDAADLDAARRALRRVFESFTLDRYADDAIRSPLAIGRDDHDEPTTEQAQRAAPRPGFKRLASALSTPSITSE